jgi:tyramine---L-glutamate ligase
LREKERETGNTVAKWPYKMRLFICEYCTSGLAGEGGAIESLLPEGMAMLGACLADFGQLSGIQVATQLGSSATGLGPASHSDEFFSQWLQKLQQNLSPGLPHRSNIFVARVTNPQEADAQFDEEVAVADATLVIAPETGGILSNLVSRVRTAGKRSLNASLDLIELGTNKLRFARFLSENGLRGPATCPLSPNTKNWLRELETLSQPPWVIKPIDGAGGTLTFLVRNENDLREAQLAYAESQTVAIGQKFVSGRPISLAWIGNGQTIKRLPVAVQSLSQDGKFQYQGGEIPASLAKGHLQRLETCSNELAGKLSGLAGYVGVDLVYDHTLDSQPTIIELNPRFCSSYTGYRRLARFNLASWFELPGVIAEAEEWQAKPVAFSIHGQ